jgi:hypothetical protein
MGTQATQSQLSFISKSRNASPERDEIFQESAKEIWKLVYQKLKGIVWVFKG